MPSSWSLDTRATAVAVAVAVLSVALASCTAGQAGPTSASPASTTSTTSTSSSSPSPSPTPSATPSPTPSPTTTTASTPATVALTGNGVGPLAWDTPGATAAVAALLGTPDAVEPFPSECGVAGVQELRYGGLRIAVQDDALMSWQVGSAPPLPAVATLPGGVVAGQPFSAATGRPGAGAPQLLDNYGIYQVQVDEPGAAAPVFYWADTNDPTAPIMLVAGRYVLGCG